jgi:hypothetical protein
MKKKVKMTCILKSGAVVEDTAKIDKKHTRAWQAISEMRTGIENSLGYKEPKLSNFTFGTTTICVSEIAAITFKEY